MTTIPKKSLAISMSSDAAKRLEDAISKVIVEYNEVIEKDNKVFGDWQRMPGVDAVLVRNRLAEVLKDGKVFRIEAPKLFDKLFKDAGDDHILSPEEADKCGPFLTTHLADEMFKTLSSLLIGDMAAYPGKLASGDEFSVGYVKRSIEGIFAPASKEEIKKITVDLNLIGILLTDEIEYLENYVKELRERERSFWNYVSAENTLGISGWAPTYWNIFFGEEERSDCVTLSSAEFDGARDLLKELYSIKTGLDILKGWLESGQLTDNGFYVQEFLNSPFATAANIYGNLGLRDMVPNPYDVVRTIYLFQIRRAVQLGATRLSYAYAKRHKDLFPYDDANVDNIMPSRLFQVVEGRITDLAEWTVSLQSLLIWFGLGLIGRSIGKAFNVVKELHKLKKFTWVAKVLVPGMLILPVSSSKKIYSILNLITNLGGELSKLSAYTYLGHQIDRRKGADIAARICMGSAGFMSGLLSTVGQRFLQELARGKAGDISRAVFASEAVEAHYMDALVAYGGGAPVLKSFSLPKALPMDELLKMISSMKGQVERSIQQAGRSLEKVQSLLRQIEQIARDGAKVTKTGQYVREAQQLVSSQPPPKAIDGLEGLLRDMRKAISTARGDAVPASRTSYGRVPETGGKGGGGGGGNVRASVASIEARADGSGLAATWQRFVPPKILSDCLARPPGQLTADMLRQASAGKISISFRAQQEVIRVYGELPAGRQRAFWQAIKDLSSGKANRWESCSGKPTETIAFADPDKLLYRGKTMSTYQLFAQPTDEGTFMLVGFKPRGN